MPSDGISIVFSIRDGGSKVLKTLGDNTKSLDKETQQLTQTYAAMKKANDPLIKAQADLKSRLEIVKKQVADNRSEWKKYDSELARTSMNEAIAEQDELKRQLKDVEDQIKSNSKSMSEYRETMRKASAESEGGTFEKLAQAGLFAMVGTSASQLAGSLLGGLAGQSVSGAISSTLSGAATGFALGGVAGAGIGALAGGINGLTQIYTAQDDAFKSYYQEAIQTVMDEQATAITSGSSIAGSREQTLMAFSQRFGSDAAAAAYLDQVKTMAGRTNYSYDEITGYSKLLLNSYSANETFGVLQRLSDATAGLGLGTGDVSTMISSLSRMRTTGKATQEYLNAFSERGVDVYSALAGFAGGDRSKVQEMISGGKIGGVEAAQAILDYIDQQFGGLSDKLATTYDAMVANLEDAEANMEAMAGEGYNEKRKEGLAAQQEWLTGNRAMEDAYKAIGAWEAELENSKEQYIRDAVDAIMGTDEYIQAMSEGDAVTMGRLIMEAKVKGMNEYNASDGAQLALESELALAGKIREDTASNQAYWDAGYRKSQEYSKGLAAGLITEENVKTVLGAVGETTSSVTAGLYGAGVDYGGSGYAFGLGRVPYDGFPAILHEGERVLTAGEARAQDRAGGASISIQVNGLSVREEADVDRVAAALYDKLQTARMAG